MCILIEIFVWENLLNAGKCFGDWSLRSEPHYIALFIAIKFKKIIILRNLGVSIFRHNDLISQSTDS